MLNFNGIDHINMNVKNLEESISFYKKLFGFEVKESGKFSFKKVPFAIIGKSGLGMLCLYEKKELKENDKSHFAHIGFNIDFIPNLIQKLKDLKVEIVNYNESGIIDYPDSQSIYIKDPSGYEIELSKSFAGKL